MSENDDGSVEDEVEEHTEEGGEHEGQKEPEEAEESEKKGIEEGDYVRLAYTATTVPDEDDEDDEEMLVDTTSEQRASEEGVDTDDQEFGPRTIAVGEGHLFGAVEEALVGNGAGDTGEVVVPAEDAFGEHDPDDVETVSANKIDEDDRYPGARVNLEGRQGYVETIIGGRARIDFNHPLAGEDVRYEFEILDVVDDEEEQIVATIDTYTGTEVEIETDTVTETETRMEEVESDEDEDDDEPPELEEVEEEVEKRVLYIEATPEMSMNQQWLLSKQQVVDELMHDFEFDRVVVRETFDHDDVHGGMPGMGGMMPGMGGDIGEIEDMDEEEIEELAEEMEGVEVEE
jgi:FKBP-type peptidyl-prolyl cis-trans isomerase SlyD